MKKLLILLLGISSCASQHNIAERKLKKAIKHDSTIVSSYYKDTILTGVIKYALIDTTPEIDRYSNWVSSDTLLSRISKIQRPNQKDSTSELFLYRDSNTSISVKKDKNDQLSVSFKVKSSIKIDTLLVPYYIKANVSGKLITIEKEYPIYHYFIFWLMALVLVVILYAWINSTIHASSNRTNKTN